MFLIQILLGNKKNVGILAKAGYQNFSYSPMILASEKQVIKKVQFWVNLPGLFNLDNVLFFFCSQIDFLYQETQLPSNTYIDVVTESSRVD